MCTSTQLYECSNTITTARAILHPTCRSECLNIYYPKLLFFLLLPTTETERAPYSLHVVNSVKRAILHQPNSTYYQLLYKIHIIAIEIQVKSIYCASRNQFKPNHRLHNTLRTAVSVYNTSKPFHLDRGYKHLYGASHKPHQVIRLFTPYRSRKTQPR